MLEGAMGLHGTAIWMSLLTGVLLAAVYDGLRVGRIVFTGRPMGPVGDFFCLLFCGLVTYLLAIAVDYGRVRFFLLACEVIGAAVYFCTIGAVTGWMARHLHRGFAWCGGVVSRRFWGPLRRHLAKWGSALERSGRRGAAFLEKRIKKRKNPLKSLSRLVYNQAVDVSKQVAQQQTVSAKGEEQDEGDRRKKKKK